MEGPGGSRAGCDTGSWAGKVSVSQNHLDGADGEKLLLTCCKKHSLKSIIRFFSFSFFSPVLKLVFLAERDNAQRRYSQQRGDVRLIFLTPCTAGFSVLAQT